MQFSLTCNLVSLSGLLAIVFSTGSAWAAGPVVPLEAHLALGDSITFGLDPALLVASPKLPKPSDFIGYPELIASRFKLTGSKSLNAGCPGETSGSFLNAAAPDNGCNQEHVEPGFTFPPFKTTVGLHVNYRGSQIDYALKTLKTNKKIDLVTLSIGANDLLLIANACAAAPDFAVCAQGQLAFVIPNYMTNLTRILTALRVEGDYKGKLVLLTLFAPDNQPLTLQAVGALNFFMQSVAAPFGVIFADGFTAFQQTALPFGGDPCAAGLVGLNPNNTCGQHPSPKGQQLLADTILAAASIN